MDSTHCSGVVPHPSTKRAQTALTSLYEKRCITVDMVESADWALPKRLYSWSPGDSTGRPGQCWSHRETTKMIFLRFQTVSPCLTVCTCLVLLFIISLHAHTLCGEIRNGEISTVLVQIGETRHADQTRGSDTGRSDTGRTDSCLTPRV